MASMIRKTVVQSLLDFIAKTRKTLGKRIIDTIAMLKTWLPTTVQPVTNTVQGAYTALIDAVAKWLDRPAEPGPDGKVKLSTSDRLTALAGRALTLVETQAKKFD